MLEQLLVHIFWLEIVVSSVSIPRSRKNVWVSRGKGVPWSWLNQSGLCRSYNTDKMGHGPRLVRGNPPSSLHCLSFSSQHLPYYGSFNIHQRIRRSKNCRRWLSKFGSSVRWLYFSTCWPSSRWLVPTPVMCQLSSSHSRMFEYCLTFRTRS
jgi:hypothetical protein